MCQVFPKLKGDTPLKSYMESVMENKKEFLDQLDYTKERCPPCSKNLNLFISKSFKPRFMAYVYKENKKKY